MATLYVHTVTVSVYHDSDGDIATASMMCTFKAGDDSDSPLSFDVASDDLRAFFAAKGISKEARKSCLEGVLSNGGVPLVAPVVVFLEVNDSPEHPKADKTEATDQPINLQEPTGDYSDNMYGGIYLKEIRMVPVTLTHADAHDAQHYSIHWNDDGTERTGYIYRDTDGMWLYSYNHETEEDYCSTEDSRLPKDLFYDDKALDWLLNHSTEGTEAPAGDEAKIYFEI